MLVGGGATDRSENAPLAAALSARFTVLNYDRRGRGRSGDTAPYAVEREVEDLAALLAVAGGTAHVHGVSSGGALALAAAAAGLPIDRLSVYEVPWSLEPGFEIAWRAYVEELGALLAAGRPGDAFARFMQLAGSSEDDIAAARAAPVWPSLEALAPTLAYDAACLGDGRPDAAGLARIDRPVLVLTGSPGPDAPPWAHALAAAADATAAAVADGQRLRLADQGHVADPAVLAPVLERFYAA